MRESLDPRFAVVPFFLKTNVLPADIGQGRYDAPDKEPAGNDFCTRSEKFRDRMAFLPDWRGVERALRHGALSGRDGHAVGEMLRSVDDSQLHRARTALVLDALRRSSRPMVELYEIVAWSYEWKSLVLKYFSDVCRLGYAEIDREFAALSDEGERLLSESLSEGFDRAFWGFVQRRIHETVTVVCPFCGTENGTRYSYGAFRCGGCSRTLRLGDFSSVRVFSAEDASWRCSPWPAPAGAMAG